MTPTYRVVRDYHPKMDYRKGKGRPDPLENERRILAEQARVQADLARYDDEAKETKQRACMQGKITRRRGITKNPVRYKQP